MFCLESTDVSLKEVRCFRIPIFRLGIVPVFSPKKVCEKILHFLHQCPGYPVFTDGLRCRITFSFRVESFKNTCKKVWLIAKSIGKLHWMIWFLCPRCEIRPRSFLLGPVIQRKDKRLPTSLYFVMCPMGLFCHLSGDYFVCQILFF